MKPRRNVTCAVHPQGTVLGSSLMNNGHLVQVPVDLGVLISDIASMTEDFPVDCSPARVSDGKHFRCKAILGSGMFSFCNPRPSSRLIVEIASLTCTPSALISLEVGWSCSGSAVRLSLAHLTQTNDSDYLRFWPPMCIGSRPSLKRETLSLSRIWRLSWVLRKGAVLRARFRVALAILTVQLFWVWERR
jgi:hypothetical protein